MPHEAKRSVDKNMESRELNSHLEYELKEINIELEVFSESEDLLQFPQFDEFLQSTPVNLPESLVDDAKPNERDTEVAVPFMEEKYIEHICTHTHTKNGHNKC